MTPHLSGDTTTLRAAAVARLLHLRRTDELTSTHIRLTAAAFGTHPRTVQRWIANAQVNDGTYTPRGRACFTLTPRMHDVLAQWCGNAAAAYRDLQEHPDPADPPLPARATFYRAVQRELTPGRRAGLRGGEAARRLHDVHAGYPSTHRNSVWETDHVEASVWVDVDGLVCKPWITWFIDASTDAVTGVAITPQSAHSGSILLALRDALLCDSPHPPFGGLPSRILVDGGKDFLSNALRDALGAFAIDLIELPPRRPELKPHVEALNGAVKKMLFRGMPGYTDIPTAKLSPAARPPATELLGLEAFITLLLDWVGKWNHLWPKDCLNGRTPAQAWAEDPTPLYSISPKDVHTFTLQRHGVPLTITKKGVRWNKRSYVDDWMQGRGGDKVHLRYLPHEYQRVELYDAATDRYLGPAFAVDTVTPEQRRALRRARERQARELKAQLRRANTARKARFAPQTQSAPPREQHRLAGEDVEQQLREAHASDLAKAARPDYFPPLAPSPAFTQDTARYDHPSPPVKPNLTQAARPERFPLPAPSPAWEADATAPDTTEDPSSRKPPP